MMLTWFPPRVQPREGWTRVIRVRGPVLKLLKILGLAAFQNEIQVAVLSPLELCKGSASSTEEPEDVSKPSYCYQLVHGSLFP